MAAAAPQICLRHRITHPRRHLPVHILPHQHQPMQSIPPRGPAQSAAKDRMDQLPGRNDPLVSDRLLRHLPSLCLRLPRRHISHRVMALLPLPLPLLRLCLLLVVLIPAQQATRVVLQRPQKFNTSMSITALSAPQMD